MKILSLNCWGGKVEKELFDFITRNKDVDVFCFQEIFHKANTPLRGNITKIKDANHDLFDHISTALLNHTGIFCPVYADIYGIAMFVKKDVEIIKTSEIILFENKYFAEFKTSDIEEDHTRKMQWVQIKSKNEKYLIMNVHGHWTPNGKGDDPDRIIQSKNILDFSDSQKTENKILCGDFNLRPDTESIRMLEKYFKNLVIENKFKTTRSPLYTKSTEKFADYMFVSENIEVKNFDILKDVVSDHLPLLLEL